MREFKLVAGAPFGVVRLRALIVALGLSGRLTTQNARTSGAWPVVRLRDLALTFQNGAASRGDAGGVPTTVVRLADITAGEIDGADPRVLPIRAADRAKYLLKQGDILVIRVNGSADLVGRFIVCRSDLDAIHCDHFIRVRLDTSVVLPEYLRLVGDSASVRARITSLFVSTAGQKTVNQGHIGSIAMLLPPLAKQQHIVARVEELMKLCDALEQSGRLADEQHARLTSTLFDALAASESAHALAENWARIAEHFDLLLDRPEAIDALEQTILQLAVRGLLVPQAASAGGVHDGAVMASVEDLTVDSMQLPAGWERVRLLDVCSVSGGSTPSKARADFWDGKVPWVSPKDMKRDVISDAIDHVSQLALEQTSLSLVPVGSVLVVVRGMILAHSFPVATTSVPVTINQDMKAFTPRVAELAPYLVLVCKGFKREILSLVERSTHGTCKLESAKLFGWQFGLPPLGEQHRIVARVEELRRLCAQLRERLTKARRTQSQLADALVAEAVA